MFVHEMQLEIIVRLELLAAQVTRTDRGFRCRMVARRGQLIGEHIGHIRCHIQDRGGKRGLRGERLVGTVGVTTFARRGILLISC